MKKRYKLVLFFILAITSSSKIALSQPTIDISPKNIDLEYVLCNQIVEKVLDVTNMGSEPLSISGIRSSCDCIVPEISNNFLNPGKRARIDIKFDTDQKQVDGKFIKYIYIQSNDPNQLVSRITLTGTALRNPRADGRIEINLFYSEGCKGCEEIKGDVLNRLRREYPEKLIINENEISNIDNYTKLMDLEKQYSVSKNVPMTLFIANTYLLGKEEVERDIDKIVSLLLKSENKSTTSTHRESTGETNLKDHKEGIINRFGSFSILAVLGAGLADQHL